MQKFLEQFQRRRTATVVKRQQFQPPRVKPFLLAELRAQRTEEREQGVAVFRTVETAFLNPDRRLRNRSQYHAHTARVRLTQITRKKRKVKAARSTLRKTPRDREHDQGDSRLRKLL